MKPSDFKYFKANSLDRALDILNSEENIKIIAGGQSLVPVSYTHLRAHET